MVERFRIKKGDTLLMVDFLNMFYKSAAIHKNLSHNGIPTGGLFGVATAISSYVLKFRPSKIVICSDCPPYFRKLEYPEYKENRNTKDKDQIAKNEAERKLCREFIHKTGIPFLEIKGLEADDIFALLSDKYNYAYNRLIAVSNDSDLMQLFRHENFHMYKSNTGKLYSLTDFKMDHPEITPRQWVDVLAYTGGHNNLNGIDDVGIITAKKLITNKAFYTKNYVKFIKSNKKRIEKEKQLTKIPFYKFKTDIVMPHRGKFNSRDVIRFLSSHGITYTDRMEKAFGYIHNK